jgi:hypothetical protein
MGVKRIAVFVNPGDEPVSEPLLHQLAAPLLNRHLFECSETHWGVGTRGHYDHWWFRNWAAGTGHELIHAGGAAPTYSACPACLGTGRVDLSEPLQVCQVCEGRPWRQTWEFLGLFRPGRVLAEAVESGEIAPLHILIGPDGRLCHNLAEAVRDFPNCWAVSARAD